MVTPVEIHGDYNYDFSVQRDEFWAHMERMEWSQYGLIRLLGARPRILKRVSADVTRSALPSKNYSIQFHLVIESERQSLWYM